MRERTPVMVVSLLPILFCASLLHALPLSAPQKEELVAKEAGLLSEESISEDVLVIQEIVQDHTIYRHDKTERKGAPVFVRKGSDEGKVVVVLKDGEDFIPSCGKEKSTYVVLKQQAGAEGKNRYRVLFAYVKSMPDGDKVEWGYWTNEMGNSRDKGLQFGQTRCSRSNLVPCKKDATVALDDAPDYEDFDDGPVNETTKTIMPVLPYVHPKRVERPNSGPDFLCDLLENDDRDRRLIGATVSAFTQAMAILTGAQLVYREEEALFDKVKKDIEVVAKEQKSKGRGFGRPVSQQRLEKGAQTLLDFGRQSVAGGAMVFFMTVMKVGALAMNEVPIQDRPEGSLDDATNAQLQYKYKVVGLTVLRSLFHGVDEEDEEMKPPTPYPNGLLREEAIQNLVEGRKFGDGMPEASGRGGPLSFIFGEQVGSAQYANGNQVLRQYKAIQKDGSVTGSKAMDNFNFIVDNTFQQAGKKSAGQIFTENLSAGCYVPYGLFEDAADHLGGAVLGIERVSNDRTYMDELLHKGLTVGGGAVGQVVDTVGDILSPFGMGGFFGGVAGLAGMAAGAGGCGAAMAGPSGPVVSSAIAGYQLLKMGAKAMGFGGVIGMGQSAPNEGGMVNNDRHYGQQMGRRKRDVLTEKQYGIQALTDVDLFSHLGWKAIDLPQGELAETNFTSESPFNGFGNCKKVPGASLDDAISAKSAAKFYFTTMRTHCLKDQLESFNDIVTEGYIKFNSGDKTFDLNDKHKAFSQAKLSGTEENALMKAFEMMAYSKAYIASLKETPTEGSKFSATIRKLAMEYLEAVKTKAVIHCHKLVRNLAKLVKTAFTKNLEDLLRLNHCKRCYKTNFYLTLDDAAILSGLLEFVVKEQMNPEYNSLSKAEAFSKVLQIGKSSFTKRIMVYFN